jgi:hypothetical protein
MRRRSHRQRRAAWISLISPVSGYEGPFTRPVRTGRIRWLVHTGALLSVIILRDVLTRWWPVVAGVVLTTVGFILRSGPGSMILLPGLLLLVSAPFVLPSPKEDRTRRRKLERELAAYSTPAQRGDLEVILDRYPDTTTRELREILSTQARAGGKSQVPGGKRY